ncbi:MAG: hypothetical protein CM15mP68_6470 [Pseudomonadota bacterium]|nr:MAG: hypothetical protein CM15mP68_6470 [Pseudomonadota bacterium]
MQPDETVADLFACLSWPRYDREYYTCRYNYAYNNRRTAARPLCRSNDQFVEQFTASVGFDRRLYQEDIAGSIAHARMLEKISVLSKEECSSIVNGLNDILAEITSGKFDWRVELEDVHMNIEHQLIERIGDTGKNCIPAVLGMIKLLPIFACICAKPSTN